MSFKLRPHQVTTMDSITEFLKDSKGKNGIIVAPTGAGKSLYVANTAKSVSEPILCLQPSRELLEQNYSKYISYGEKASIFSASMGVKDVGNVTFATPQSVANDLSLFKRFKYILIDECHLASKTGGAMHNIVKSINPKKVIGLTATPIYLMNTFEGSQLKMMNRCKDSFFKTIIHVTQIKELVDNNYWSPLIYNNRYVDTSMLKANSTGSDYTDRSLMEMYEANNTRVNLLSEIEYLKAEGRKSILVFVPSVEEANQLAMLVPNSASVSAKTPKKERDNIINRFKELDIHVVINCNILICGFDHPQLDAIIMTRPTASIAVYYQVLGRGCRIHPLKENCKIVDLSGNSVKFGKVENLTFENIDNFGWGMFSNDKLLSGVPMVEGFNVTKDEIRAKGTTTDSKGGLTVFPFGKHQGKTFEAIFKEDPQYLSWICSDKFVPSFDKIIKTKENVTLFLKSKILVNG